ncbi:MAG: hypothetical protein EU536_02890 [Promethearchaeota archaeon]|nr:MAG: hypothetical protein EU536_02890 [Candidatus Lokiarchaeota archaeon]
MSIKTDELLTRIEKDRYLISCKCKLCNKQFKDIILGSQHVYDEHPKREIKNVVDNLVWDLQTDLKQWNLLQTLKLKRDAIINRLNDEKAINKAEIPATIEIVRRKVDISELITTLQEELATKEPKAKKKEGESESEETEDAEEEIEEEIDERDFEDASDDSSEDTDSTNNADAELEDDDLLEDEDEDETSGTPKSKSQEKAEIINDRAEVPKLIELLEREVDKYLRSIKRISMADDVKRALDGKKIKRPNLNKLAEQLDYYLGISKAIRILKDSL